MKERVMLKKSFLLFVLGIIAGSVQADIQLNSLFQDHMVIQRETQAPVWGWADSGERIMVKASWGAKAETVAASNGTWMVKLSTPAAGGPHTITIAGKNRVELTDVLSGEVWFCSGQSNMEYELGWLLKDAREAHYQPLVEYLRNEVATAADTQLRQIKVPKKSSPFEVQTNFEGEWISVASGSTAKFSAMAYFFARELRRELKVPVGLVLCAWGGTRVQPWLSEEAYLTDPARKEYFRKSNASLKLACDNWSEEEVLRRYEDALQKWEEGGQVGRKPRKAGHPTNTNRHPACLFNGMVSAVIPYAIRGAIWYQGESNHDYMTAEYETYFSTMISDWRTQWGQGDFPFYYAQLAAFESPDRSISKFTGWASICDQQRRTLALAHTGMAVLLDVGEEKDIHPHHKMEAGRRLSLWALARDYGMDVPAVSGPLYRDYQVKDGQVLVRFDEAGSGLMIGNKTGLTPVARVDEPLKQFEVAGADGVWKPAEAKIVGVDQVAVSHPEIPEPVAVRYAWASNPVGANLYNVEGLPASVFTTE